MRYIPSYRVWLDEFQLCPYGDYDWTRKTVAEVIDILKHSEEAFYLIDCATWEMRDAIDRWIDAHGEYADYVRFTVHGEV